MENKEDLLNLDNNKKNPKKILIYGAAAFLIFVVSVIVFAVIQGNTSSQNNAVIPPQVKEEPLFKEIPIEQNSTEKANNENKNDNVENIQNQKNFKEEANIIKKPVLKENNNSNIQQSQIVNSNKQTFKQTNVKPIIKKEVKVIPVKIEKKDTEANTKITMKKTTKNKNYISKGNYYIQVAALMKYTKPNKKFLAIIRKYGYHYKLYPVSINKNGKTIKMNKLLIGPFASKNDAKKELSKIKKYITQNAFIFKAK